MLQLRAINGPTGRLLKEMLQERGLLEQPVQGVVHYGYHPREGNLPTLNAKAGCQNKFEELEKMAHGGVQTVPFARDPRHLKAPMFGRKYQHTRGRDIRFGGQGSDYYTEVIPKAKEFRVWVFRDKHLATYEKILAYPNRLGRRGRNKDVWNWGNGYAYTFVRPEVSEQRLKDIAIRAVAALDLDFGAVDVLLGNNRQYYVLEVNTAPGTQGEARQGVTSLVNKIERWARNGFKAKEEGGHAEESDSIGYLA